MGTLLNHVFLLRRSILTLLLLCFAISIASAQQRTITGKVTSKAEGPLPGVNIVVQGTITGAITDINGAYSITVPGPEAILVFSSIGFNTESITVGNLKTVDVEMVSSTAALGEVVVVGYGT